MKRAKTALVNNLKAVWENDHAEEISEAYNKIAGVLSGLDMYSANMVVNLISYQTMQKTVFGTVGKTKEEVV